MTSATTGTGPSRPCYLTLDNGGTNTKALLFGLDGRAIASSSFPTRWIQPTPGMREIDLHRLRESLFQAIRNVLADAGVNGDDVRCISTVGHGKGLYVLDRMNQVFRNGILSTDERGAALAERFEADSGKIQTVSAQHVMASQAPVLLRWLKDNAPADYEGIGAVLSAKDFVRFLLSGVACQEIGDASGNNLVNLHTRSYDRRLTDFFGIPEMFDRLPELVESSAVVARVSFDAANGTGLTPGTPICGGLFDIDAGALASGVLDDTHMAVIAGTWNINVFAADEPTVRMDGVMNSLYLHDRTLVEASSPTSAGNLGLILDLLMPGEQERLKELGQSVYGRIEEDLAAGDASSTGVVYLPFLYGSNTDPYASASFLGIDSTTSPMQMIRSVYEGIAFAHRQHVEQLLAAVARPPASVRLSGGAANSPAWMQIFADVLGLPVETLEGSEATGLGGAITAAVAIGDQPSYEQAVNRMVRISRRYDPRPDQHAIYERKYQAYRGILAAMDGHWNVLHSLTRH